MGLSKRRENVTLCSPDFIIFDEPTRGIDVQAKVEIWKLMRELAGGSTLGGGMGGVIGTVEGVLILTLLNNLFNLVGVSTFYQWIIKGAIIVGAVAIYHVQRK